MLLNKVAMQKFILVSADGLSLMGGFFVAILVTQLYHISLLNSPWSNFFHFGASKMLGVIVIATFWYNELYVKRRPFWEELLQTYRIIGFLIIINLGLSFVMGKGSLKVMIVSCWVTFALILPFMRIIAKMIMNWLNLWQRDLYILGCGDTALTAHQLFNGNKLMGYNIRNFVLADSNMTSVSTKDLPMPVISIGELLKVKNLDESEVVVALNAQELKHQLRHIDILQSRCLYVSVLPEISGLSLYGAHIDHFFGSDQLILRLNNNLSRWSNMLFKRIFDLACVLAGLIVLAPLFIIIAIAIKLTTGSKIFYLHKRVGRNGREFYCIKFQTMYANSAELLADLLATNPEAKALWEKDFKLKDDPRITKIGGFLRKTSLDELPQLFNVLKGEMSLVGPRPIVEAEIDKYRDGYHYYQMVLPGVTGLWQVSGRNDIDYKERVRLDEWYVKNWSLWYDIVILIKTIKVVITRSGAY